MNQKQLLMFEVLDRASIQFAQLQRSLENHQGLTKKTRKKLDKAVSALGDLYQTAASEFHDEGWRSE